MMLPGSFRLVLVITLIGVGFSSACLSGANTFNPGTQFTNPAFAEHVTKLQKQVPVGFTVIIEPPFIVLGDEAPEVVQRHATRTVKWAVDKLKQDFFQHD